MRSSIRALLAISVIVTTLAQPIAALAQGTAFNYHGSLTEGGGPGHGVYDLRFGIYDAANGGIQQGDTLTNTIAVASNGLFTVTLDFGTSVFTGPGRWLEIGARTNGGGEFATLSPRQPILATPYAMHAGSMADSAVTSAKILDGGVSNTDLADGSVTTPKLGDSAVTTPKIADGAVTTPKLADAAVTAAKLAANSVQGDAILDGAIGPADLGRLAEARSILVITNPTPVASDNFGSVIAAVGTDKFAIGVPLNDVGGSGSGVVHIFNLAGTRLNTITNPSPADNDNFGRSVAGLGTDRLVIGSPGDNTNFANSGLVHIYNINGSRLHSITNPTPGNDDRFGEVLAIVGGSRIAAGVPSDGAGGAGDNSGVVHLFTTNGVYQLTITNPSPASGDNFGVAVAGVGLDKVVVGAHTDDTHGFNVGIAYLFSTSGTLLATYTNPAVGSFDTSNNQFGRAVAGIGTDRVLISAPSFGSVGSKLGIAYLFDTSGKLLRTIQPNWVSGLSQFGSALTAVGGDMMAIGGFNQIVPGLHTAGGALLLDLSGNILADLAPPGQAAGDNYGEAMTGVGLNHVVVGSPERDTTASGSGEAYVFALGLFNAGVVADAVRAGSVDSASLADGAVTADKLAPDVFDFSSGSNAFAGSFIGDGSGLSNVNATALGGVPAANFWRTGGNSGTNPNWYLGTVDTQPLELRVNSTRALRLAPTASGWPNIVAGASNNVIFSDVTAATIGGGYNNSIGEVSGGTFVGGGRNISVGPRAAGSFVGGGHWNALGDGAVRSVIAGGYSNSIAGSSSTNAASISRDITDGTSNTLLLGEAPPGNATIGGGYLNRIGADSSAGVIAGGFANQVGDGTANTFIGGGRGNTNTGSYAVIPGGRDNLAAGDYSFAGGRRSRALHTGAFVWGDATDADFSSTGDGQFLIRATGGVGINKSNPVATLDVEGSIRASAFAGDGSGLTNLGLATFNGGAIDVAFQFTNQANVFVGTMAGDGGGLTNISAANAWHRNGNTGTIAGQDFVGTTDNQPLELKVNGLRALRLEPNTNGAPNVIGGTPLNYVFPEVVGATISGGGAIIFSGEVLSNSIWGDFSSIGGGLNNAIAARAATIAGGGDNMVEFKGFFGAIGGGQLNTNSGLAATVPGGYRNYARGNYSLAAGHQAKAIHTGTFVWADSQDADFASSTNDQFLIRAAGGVGIGETTPEALLHVTDGSAGSVTASANAVAVFEKSGAAYVSLLTPTNSESGMLFGSPTHSADGGVLFNANVARGLSFRTAGNLTKMVIEAGGNVGIGTMSPTNKLHVNGGVSATAFVTTSDRNAKENFAPVSPREVLDKVTTLPITTWNFKGMNDGRHIGPMAQDFHAAFGLGGGDTTITSVDPDGVALAAIQGLNQKLEHRLAQKETEITELRARLEKLEKLLGGDMDRR